MILTDPTPVPTPHITAPSIDSDITLQALLTLIAVCIIAYTIGVLVVTLIGWRKRSVDAKRRAREDAEWHRRHDH